MLHGRPAAPRVARHRSTHIYRRIATPRTPRSSSIRTSIGSAASKPYDLLVLSNLCLDVLVPSDELPPADPAVRHALLTRLTDSHQSPTDSWELGGSFNTAIAAARLGLRVGAVGHVGRDAHGRFVAQVLQEEGIAPVEPVATGGASPLLERTLVCFVLVDPQGRHAFCSVYDFGPWPLLEGVESLPTSAMQALRNTRAVFTNGFVFDDLPLELVKDAVCTASRAGAAICFDPGPRCFTMREGTRRQALETLLDLSDIVLMTLEEAREVTGCDDPAAAACAILTRPGTKTEWCVVKQGAQGALLMTKEGLQSYHVPAIPVNVSDTVGCGDSFAAAICMGFVRSYDVHATLVLANAVGAATAMGRGAGRNVARAGTVRQLLLGAVGGGRHNADHVYGALQLLHESLVEGSASAASSLVQWPGGSLPGGALGGSARRACKPRDASAATSGSQTLVM